MDLGKSLKPTDVDRAVLDHGRHRCRAVQQSVKRRLRPTPASHFQAFLPAAHARQPIVNQGNSEIIQTIHSREFNPRQVFGLDELAPKNRGSLHYLLMAEAV
jgi:hypothetical protein